MSVVIDENVTAEEVVALRQLSGWDGDVAEWKACIDQNLLNVSVRTPDGTVVGAGFLCGNQRHAEMVDLVVHPDHRNKGIGKAIVQFIVNYALERKIKYFGLTYDKKQPWLKDFYESEGFKPIDFAMWHESSL